MAFNAVDAFPALAESRSRLLSATADGNGFIADVVSAIESDIALCIAALRIANRREHGNGHVESALGAARLLCPRTMQALASRAHTFDFFQRVGVWKTAPEHFRLHALATQRAADRIASEVNYEHRDRLAITSLLHDVGKLVLIHAYPGYPSNVPDDSLTPSEGARRERAELGVNHATIGGVLLRRWGLPVSLAVTIEEHHNPEADSEAALVRLADMLAHHEQGARISPRELLHSARAVELGPQTLRRLMYELPGASSQRQVPTDPCPLSGQAPRAAAAQQGPRLQGDRIRSRAVSEHHSHAPAQRLRQTRCGQPRTGRAVRHRTRLAVAPVQTQPARDSAAFPPWQTGASADARVISPQ